MANTVSENIRKLRVKKGISQDRLSKDADLALNTVVKREIGESLNPTVDTLEKIVYPVGSRSNSFWAKALVCPFAVLTKEGRAGGRIV
ncbi:MAG: hypothetical protein A3J06_03870 [Candidatus Moranbacteria bacterium RIFCSPLOWO2_02_FULL_48_19]|nr:MAG: hypothetical protein A3J06_03870 [Candidatus Moranbacteria bacterium RIFCSPLOWO2_02_FULL_48_19]